MLVSDAFEVQKHVVMSDVKSTLNEDIKLKCYALLYLVFGYYNNNLTSNTKRGNSEESFVKSFIGKIERHINDVFEDRNTRIRHFRSNPKLAQRIVYKLPQSIALSGALELMSLNTDKYGSKTTSMKRYVNYLGEFMASYFIYVVEPRTGEDEAFVKHVDAEVNKELAKLQQGGHLMNTKRTTGITGFLIHSIGFGLSSCFFGIGGAAYMAMLAGNRETKFAEYKHLLQSNMARIGLELETMPDDEKLKIETQAQGKEETVIQKLKTEWHYVEAEKNFRILSVIDEYIYENPTQNVEHLLNFMKDEKYTGINLNETFERIKSKKPSYGTTSFGSRFKRMLGIAKHDDRQQEMRIVDVKKIIRAYLMVLDRILTDLLNPNQAIPAEQAKRLMYYGECIVMILNDLLSNNRHLCTNAIYINDGQVVIERSSILDQPYHNAYYIENYVHCHSEVLSNENFREGISRVSTILNIETPLGLVHLLYYRDVFSKTHVKTYKGTDRNRNELYEDTLIVQNNSDIRTRSAGVVAGMAIGAVFEKLTTPDLKLYALTGEINLITPILKVIAWCGLQVSSLVSGQDGGQVKYKKTDKVVQLLGRKRCVYKLGRVQYIKVLGEYLTLKEARRRV